MGVLNATPDSFYAGSRSSSACALPDAERLIDQGADVVDVGGESTRPAAPAVALDEEWARVEPVITAIHDRWPRQCLSIDTQKAAVARRAIACGASLINDISALRHDPDMAAVAAESRAPVILMHMQGTPQTMQQNPQYDDVVDAVRAFFEERLTFAVRSGIRESAIILDPGIGFGKTVEHNVEILRRLEEFAGLGRPLLVGVSRKSFIGRLGADHPGEVLPPEDRLEGSLAAGLWAVQKGAQGLRVHDVRATRRAVKIWRTIGSTMQGPPL